MNKFDINISGVSEDTFVLSVLESLKIGASEMLKLREKISALNDDKEELSKTIQELKVSLGNSNETNLAYQSEIDNLRKEKEDLLAKEEDLESLHKSDCSNLEQNILDLNEKLSFSEKESESLRVALETANNNNEKLGEEKETIIHEKDILGKQVEFMGSKIVQLESVIVRILNDSCIDIVGELSSIADNIENEYLRDYITKILIGKDGSEVKGLSKFSELSTLGQVYRNVSLENTPTSNIATMLLWSTNEELCDIMGGAQVWNSINKSFGRFVSILDMAGISIEYPKTMAPDDTWIVTAKTDYNKAMHDLFKSIFGSSIKTKENCPIFVRRLSSTFGEDIKEGICYIA